MLGISADNARQLHHRARERLCQMLTDQYKEKEKRKKELFMIILFASLKRLHANPRCIDRFYRSRLSGLRMEPVGIDKCRFGEETVPADCHILGKPRLT